MANVFGGGGSKGGSGISTSCSSLSTQSANVSRSSVRQFGSRFNVSPVRPVSSTTSSQSTSGGHSLFNQYGSAGSISPVQSPSSTTTTQSSATTSCVLKPCVTSGGINSVLATISSQSLETTDTQIYSSIPNNYSRVGMEFPIFDLRDFYTKADIHRLLKTKADITSVYRKSEVDAAISTLSNQINQSLTAYITEIEADNKISELYDEIILYTEENFYQKDDLYTKSEINSLLDALTLGNDFVALEPDTTSRNVINPGANAAVALTIKSSSNPSITTVQHWIDDQSNSIGRIRKSGQVEFYGNMLLGQAIETWRPALDANNRRISGVADPVHGLDAINKKYLEDFVLSAIINAQLELDQLFDIDCLVY